MLLDESEHADGVKIFIGGDSSLVPLDECSIVTAPYEVDGQVVGTVGVIEVPAAAAFQTGFSAAARLPQAAQNRQDWRRSLFISRVILSKTKTAARYGAHLKSAKITLVRSEPSLGRKWILPTLDQLDIGFRLKRLMSRSGAMVISCQLSEVVTSNSTALWSAAVSTTVCGSVQ